MEKSNEQKRAIARMEAELKGTADPFEKRIGGFIAKELAKDPELATRCEENASTVEGACAYVMKQAKEMAKGSQTLCVEDKVVYGWVLHYVQDVGEKGNESPSKPSEKPAKETKKAKKEEPKDRNQMCLFDFFEEGAPA